MSGDKVESASRGEPEPQVGDAGLLFRDAAPAGPASPAPLPATDLGDVFDLADGPEEANEETPEQVPSLPRAQPEATVPRGERAALAPREQSRLDPSVLVEETWSRWAEWGTNLIVVAGWLTAILLLVYFAFGQDFYGLAFLLLLVGALVAVVLSYPMLITLERPVRVTPEQALRDYYNALSHHLPHFRRMWLLLSAGGRVCSAFGSFEGFKGYWKEQLAKLHKGHAGPFTPLVFEVVDFKSDKSAGQSRIDATYTVNVSVRGKRSEGPIHTLAATIALARGPDKMWYLETGTLPRGGAAVKSGAP